VASAFCFNLFEREQTKKEHFVDCWWSVI